MTLADFIAAACAFVLLGVVVFASVVQRRERKRMEERDKSGLGGRACRRRPPQHRLPWWVP